MDKVIFTVGYGMTRVTCPAQHRRINEFIRKVATITYEGYTRDKRGRGRERQFYMSLYRDSCFPSGLLDKILPELDPDQYIVIDQRQKPPRDPRMVFDPEMYGKLWDHQKEAFLAAKQWNRAIFKEPTGCHGLNTTVLLQDGSVMPVQSIRIGDVLMGPDSTGRTVEELYSGTGRLFEVTPVKGAPFVINEGHVLSLIGNADAKVDKITDIALIDWATASKTFRHTHKLYRTGIEFPENTNTLPIEPYFLGILLGDGCLTTSVGINTMDSEVIAEVYRQASIWGLSVTKQSKDFSLSSTYFLVAKKGKPNALLSCLKQNWLYNKSAAYKFIPHPYIIAPRKERLELLAGLIDTDGYVLNNHIDYITKSERLADDIAFLCRSLGFAAYISRCSKGYDKEFKELYFRLSISGNIDSIPTKVERRRGSKRKQKKSVLRTGFSIRYIGMGLYFGFKLSGDGRYLLSDFTVMHNSGKTNLAAAIINAAGVKTLYVVPTKNLLYQTYREFCQTFGRQNVGLIGDGQWSAYQPIVVATVQSLWQRYDDLVEFNRSFDDVKMLILDEAHHCNTTTRTVINKSGKKVKVQDRNTWFKIANRVPAYYRFGLTATPGDPGDESRSLLEAVTGLIRHDSNTMDLVEQGILVKPKPIFYRVQHPRRYKVWRVAKETGLSGNVIRNRMIAEIALQYSLKGKLVLVVVDRVDTHGRVLYDLIGSRHSLFVYGDDTAETRDSAKRLFESGKIRILIGTIYGEGVNMPKVDVVINAAGGKSKKVAIQRFGRALRRSEGKSEGILIDFMDEDRGILLEHAIERFDVYEGEGYGPTVQDYETATLL